MGRSARTPAFLDGMGYGRPPETRSTAMLGYSSQLLSIPNGCINEQMVVFNLGLRGKPGGLLLACENDTWMFAVARTIDTGGAPRFRHHACAGRVHCPGNHGQATPRTRSRRLPPSAIPRRFGGATTTCRDSPRTVRHRRCALQP